MSREATESGAFTLTLTGAEHDYTRMFWGHAVHFSGRPGPVVDGYESQYVSGHGPFTGKRRVRSGDVLRLKSERGVGRFPVLDVEYFRDPPDMWRGLLVHASVPSPNTDTP